MTLFMGSDMQELINIIFLIIGFIMGLYAGYGKKVTAMSGIKAKINSILPKFINKEDKEKIELDKLNREYNNIIMSGEVDKDQIKKFGIKEMITQ